MRGSIGLALAAIAMMAGFAAGHSPVSADGGNHLAGGGYSEVQVVQESARVSYVVFHAIDRDGFCDAAAFGAISLHPVLTDAPNDTMVNGTTGLPNPRATLDVMIDSGDGVMTETNAGPAAGVRSVTGLNTFSTYANAQAGSPIKAFPPLVAGVQDECQAWVKVVTSTGGAANVLVIFHDDAGDIGFDTLVNVPATTTVTLTPRWSLVAWTGANDAALSDALRGTGAANGGSDISSMVTAVYAWDGAAGKWLAWFPGASGIPAANTLTTLETGRPYWFAITGTSSVEWKVAQ